MVVATAAELVAVATVTRRLHSALQQARRLKEENTINPPLSTTTLESQIDDLQADIDTKYDQNYRFAAIETAARDIFYSLITSTAIDEPEFVEVWNLLDILLAGGDRGICAPELVVWLIEELLDSQTTEGCRTVFDYLESRRERLAQKDFHKKNLVFLRSCNELLRRLSRAEDASFCGRVFFFLFQTFPLGDKSSVNLRGEFHIENTTAFDESISELQSQPQEDTIMDDVKQPPTAPSNAGSKPTQSKPVSRKFEEEILDSNTLYPIFWRLQQCFATPTKLFEPKELQQFKTSLTATFAKFKSTPTVGQATVRSKARKIAADQSSANYNPKYLTSRDLFDLELSDMVFQRHICLQVLILLEFLLSLTGIAKQKILTIEHPNKSLLYDFTLSQEDTAWATQTRHYIYKTLLEPMTDGVFYNRTISTILARDQNWVMWKIESCPSIVQDAISTIEIMDIQTKLQRQTKPRKVDFQTIGAMDLDFLEDNHSGGLEALRDSSQVISPTAAELLKAVNNDELDLEMATEDEKSSLSDMIQNKTWRLLRDVRMSQIAGLDRFETGKSLQDVLSAPISDALLDTIEAA